MVLESCILGLILESIDFRSAKDLYDKTVSLSLPTCGCEMRTCKILGCRRVACHWALAIDPMGPPAARLVRGKA